MMNIVGKEKEVIKITT